MARLMSVAYTEDAVLERIKRVTRRRGWWEDKHGRRLVLPGDRLTLCRKVMGRKAGEPLVRIVDVEVLSVEREQIGWLTGEVRSEHEVDWAYAEVALEGFPGMEPDEFVRRFFYEAQGMRSTDWVTRIEWEYVNGTPANIVG